MTTEAIPIHWLAVGLLGQTAFSARFLIQWIASERKKESVVPRVFWWCSIVGGLLLFSYATYRLDPVFMLGQSAGILVYTRNLVLTRRASLVRDGNAAG